MVSFLGCVFVLYFRRGVEEVKNLEILVEIDIKDVTKDCYFKLKD